MKLAYFDNFQLGILTDKGLEIFDADIAAIEAKI